MTNTNPTSPLHPTTLAPTPENEAVVNIQQIMTTITEEIINKFTRINQLFSASLTVSTKAVFHQVLSSTFAQNEVETWYIEQASGDIHRLISDFNLDLQIDFAELYQPRLLQIAIETARTVIQISAAQLVSISYIQPLQTFMQIIQTTAEQAYNQERTRIFTHIITKTSNLAKNIANDVIHRYNQTVGHMPTISGQSLVLFSRTQDEAQDSNDATDANAPAQSNPMRRSSGHR